MKRIVPNLIISSLKGYSLKKSRKKSRGKIKICSR
jgi:hypothetical protein